ncbi:MAG: maltokinase N-terminal cap-like domain-containing protein, partial [Solirubrobacteraceae bacterium]
MSPLEHGRTPIESAIASLSSDTLLKFLERQRWFGLKGASGAAARVIDTIVVPWGRGAFAVTRVSVSTSSDTRTYQVPLAARDTSPARTPETAVVSRGEAGGKWVIVYDALHDPDFVRGLLGALESGATVTSDAGTRIVFERIGADPELGKDPTAALVAAEQSNSSLVVDDVAILKLFRTLNPGVHPDVEVARFLTTRARFAHTPALLATIRLEHDGVPTVAGVMQEYLPGVVDAWSYALERGRAYFAAPANREGPNAFLEDATQLGIVTRELHDALAGDDDDADFAPEAALPEDLDRWAHRAQQSVRDALALLERQLSAASFPRDHSAEAQALLKRREHYDGWINEIADIVGEDLGTRIRTHGDYH